MKSELPEHPSRTRFARDIVCEYVAPLKSSNKVVILCAGMPGYPAGAVPVLYALAKRGYWVFVPRYRGTWESGGIFLRHSPHLDVQEVIKGLEKGFVDAWSGERKVIAKPKVLLIGASFGGGAVLLNAGFARVSKVIALAPVVDWKTQEGTTEPFSVMKKFVREGFGLAYRGDGEEWKKLQSGTFYGAKADSKNILGKNILIIHAYDDSVVPFAPSKLFAETVGAHFETLRRAGHLGISSVLKRNIWAKIERFIK